MELLRRHSTCSVAFKILPHLRLLAGRYAINRDGPALDEFAKGSDFLGALCVCLSTVFYLVYHLIALGQVQSTY
jgi:hypothetical protein